MTTHLVTRRIFMKINTPLTQDYFDWLVKGLLQFNPETEQPLIEVCHMLFLRDYSATLQMDVAREKDGTLLRDIFTARLVGDAVVINGSPWKNPCSLLEMMIQLCVRMKEEFYTSYEDMCPVIKIIFMSMLHSLGILDENNDIVPVNLAHVYIDNFLHRNFEPNGKGSLFNLEDKTQDVDWRDVPIWNQMMAFVTFFNLFAEYDEE